MLVTKIKEHIRQSDNPKQNEMDLEPRTESGNKTNKTEHSRSEMKLSNNNHKDENF